MSEVVTFVICLACYGVVLLATAWSERRYRTAYRRARSLLSEHREAVAQSRPPRAPQERGA